MAERTRNTILPLCDFLQEDVDEDLIWRIQDLLVKSRKYLDVSALRDAFKERCSKDSTNMDVTMVSLVLYIFSDVYILHAQKIIVKLHNHLAL